MCSVSKLFSAFSTMNTIAKVYVTRNVPKSSIEMLKTRCQVFQWQSDDPVPRDELISNIKGKDALFCLLTDKIDSHVLDAAGSGLKVIGTMSVGYDHIDIAECKARGIPVGFTPDVLTAATAELTMALLLTTARKLPQGMTAVHKGEWGAWKPMWMCGQGLQHSTVGIVGMGRIGTAVAKRLIPFGISKLLYTSRSHNIEAETELKVIYSPLNDLLQQSDFVIACCALTSETQGMFNKDTFNKMKDTAIFVNTSRGGVVNQDDLYTALCDGQIGGAGLDVTSPEPLPTNSPLLSLPNCVVLPHIGSATMEARTGMAELTAQNILAVLNGVDMPCQIK